MLTRVDVIGQKRIFSDTYIFNLHKDSECLFAGKWLSLVEATQNRSRGSFVRSIRQQWVA